MSASAEANAADTDLETSPFTPPETEPVEFLGPGSPAPEVDAPEVDAGASEVDAPEVAAGASEVAAGASEVDAPGGSLSGDPRSGGPGKEGGRRRTRTALMVGLVLLLVLGVVAARVVIAGSEAFDRGVALEAAGDGEGAALAYREAITWYYPGSPQVTHAIERMWALADAAESTGDRVGARIIIGDLRSALFAIRSVYQPHAHELALCNERLAFLLAATDERVRAGVLSGEALLPRYQDAVARDHAPSVGWSLALSLGFLAWIGSTFVAIGRLVPREGGLRWRRAAAWFVVSGVTLAVWLAGATLA